jgi:hypothetical protein
MSVDKETHLDRDSDTQNPGRRNFLKTVSMGFGAMAVFGAAASVAKAETVKTKPAAKPSAAPAAAPAAAAGALELVKEDDPLPKGLGYMHDSTKAPRVDKAGTKAADQLCLNCQFYTKAGEINKEEVGKCQLFPKGVVKSNGWCKSWIKKA